MTDPPTDHARRAAAMAEDHPPRLAVLTVSDTRTVEDDESGDLIAQLGEAAGMYIAHRRLIPDDADAISAAVDAWLGDPQTDAILTTGGTGISTRDTTIDIIEQRLDVVLEGFGELFRMLSWQEIGGAAMLTRAIGGLTIRPTSTGGETFLFAMPGSTNAVRTAMDRLIAPQLPHLIWERRR